MSKGKRNPYFKDQIKMIKELHKESKGFLKSEQETYEKFPESEGWHSSFVEDSQEVEEYSGDSIFNRKWSRDKRDYSAFQIIWHNNDPIYLYGTESNTPWDVKTEWEICHIF